MGMHYISVHTPADLQALNHTPFEHLKIASQLVHQAKTVCRRWNRSEKCKRSSSL